MSADVCAQASASGARSDRRDAAVITAIGAVVLCYGLTQTMLVPTTGVFQHAFGASPGVIAWAVLTAPLLSGAVLTPLLGRLGDQCGKRRVLVGVLVVYLLSNLAAIGAWQIGVLIALRAVHGISLAVVPLGYGVLREALPRHRVGFALGLTSGLMGGTSGAALVLSGLIVDHVSWRWLFVVGSALIAVALTLVLRFVPVSPRSRQGRPDVAGAVVLALGLLGVLLGLTEGPRFGWSSPTVLGLFLLGAGCLTGFVVLARLTTAPLLDVGLLTRPAVLVANFGAFVLGVTQFVFYVLLPKLAELPTGLPPALAHRIDYGFGASVTVAGLILLPGTLVMLPASSSAGRVARRLGPRGFGQRAPLALGLAGAGFGAATLAPAHDRPGPVVLLFVVFSLGSGLATGALPKIVNDAVTADETATANGVNVVARIVGGAVGSQLAAAVVSSFPLHGTHLPAAAGFTAAFWVSAGTATVGALITLLAVWPRPTAPSPRAASPAS